MALELGPLREALLDAGASSEKAAKAAREIAGYLTRPAATQTRLSHMSADLCIWMVALNIALYLVMLGMLWRPIALTASITSQVLM